MNRYEFYLCRLYTRTLAFLMRARGRRLTIGRDTIVSWRAIIIPGAGHIHIGERCSIGAGAILNAHGGYIRVGDDVSVNYYSVLYGHGGLTIGQDTRIAAHTVIIPSEHNYQKMDVPIRKQGYTARGIEIGSDVWIGAGTRILDGVKIGDGVVIGAGSVVKGGLDPYGVYVGVPARLVKKRG